MNSRWQPGGDLFAWARDAYGPDAAYALASLDADGDTRKFQQLLSDLRTGAAGLARGSESTLGNLWQQLTTDPLAAPLESANRQIGLAVWNVVKNPFVLLAVAVLVFYWLGGTRWLQKQFA